MYQNATREQIVEALQARHSVTAISRKLRADKGRIRRIRDELGLATFVPTEQTRTLEEKWAASTRPVGDGHLEWAGERGSTSGTPVMRHREQNYSPAAIAFRIRTGRDGTGHVFAECGLDHCVAPGHVKDQDERKAERAQLRQEAAPQACKYGHASRQHGRFLSDGTFYCDRCSWMAKNPENDDRIHQAPARSPEEALRRLTRQVEGGHLLWVGPAYRGGPGLRWGKLTLSPARVAFRTHHGRRPEGNVTSICAVPHCVAGACLRDRPMRQAERKVDRLYASIFGTAA